jgi:hypothetical protein
MLQAARLSCVADDSATLRAITDKMIEEGHFAVLHEFRKMAHRRLAAMSDLSPQCADNWKYQRWRKIEANDPHRTSARKTHLT